MRSLSDFVHFGLGVPGCGPTRARKSWVHTVKPLRYSLCKGVVSVWPEGTLVARLRFAFAKRAQFFSTGHSDHARHARKNLSRFESVWIFYDFPGQKPLKYCPDVTQLAFVVGFHSFWAWGAWVWPHTRSQKLGAYRETAEVLAVQGGGFGMAGGDLRSHVSALHPPNVPNFFPRATVTMQGTHAKICRVSSPYGFSTIFRAENP